MTTTDNIVLAGEYILTGTSFWKSAEILNEHRVRHKRANMTTVPPFYYLVSHAAELFLKSALLKRGVLPANLKKPNIRHNLLGLLELLENYGSPISVLTKRVVGLLGELHKDHYMRYRFIVRCGAYKLPPEEIYKALQELLMSSRLRKVPI